MGDMTDHGGQQQPQGTFDHRAVKRGVADRGADRKLVVLDGEAIQPVYAVDVDEMAGPREAKRHGRYQALSAGQHPSVVGRDVGENRDRFLDGARCVIAEGRGFHLGAAGPCCSSRSGRRV